MITFFREEQEVMHVLTQYARSVYLRSEIAKPGGGFKRKKQAIKRYIMGERN